MSRTLALVINCGSSSLKYGVFEVKPGSKLEEISAGLVDKIGLDGCVIKHEHAGKAEKITGPLKDHGEAMEKVVEILTAAGGPVQRREDIKVVGHRVVHGGSKYSEPALVDAECEAVIEACYPLAPLHNPANLTGIRMAKAQFSVPHFAVFDTAFHATMQPESYRYAVPKELYTEHAVRRYGFHGTSYKYVSGATASMLSKPVSSVNMIICHLGNGCSMACLRDGKVVDTSMGLTPLEGLMMGTRCGDVDAGVYTFLCNHLKMSPKDVDTLMNKKSGLLGVAGTSDMREVIGKADNGDVDAILARKMCVERVRKYVGSYLVKLNGKLDAFVFTAGVGENDKGFRELVTAGLEPFGIDVDSKKNRSLKGGGAISADDSRVKVLVVPTQEELSIAQQSLSVHGIQTTTDLPAALAVKGQSLSSQWKLFGAMALLLRAGDLARRRQTSAAGGWLVSAFLLWHQHSSSTN